MAERFVRLLPLTPSPFAVHLVRPEEDLGQGGDFVRLGEPGPSARHYRAALLTETGLSLGELVLKLPLDDTMEAFFPDEGPGSGNAAVEARWAAALADLAKLQGVPGCFAELVLPSAAPDASVPRLLPPLLYCPVANRMFPIPCPVCLGELHTCRDDQTLARAGLPLHSTTSTRLLACPTCLGGGEEPRFWVTYSNGAGELAALGVRDLTELRRDLVATLERRRAEGQEVPGDSLPCPTCPDSPSCLGLKEGDRPAAGKRKARAAVATGSWVVFNSHDCPYLLTRYVPLPFTDLADRLGGRPWPEDASGAAGPGLLFGDEGSGVDGVEVLALKLVMFLQLVRAVREYYKRLMLPHLDLHPDNLAAELTEPGAYLPRLWSFRVRLLGGSSSRLVRLGETVEVVLPPRELKAPYCAPAVREFAQSAPRRADLTIDRLVPDGTDGERVRLEGRLGDANGIFPRPGVRDLVVLAIPEDIDGLGGRSIMVQLDPRGTRGLPGLPVTSEPVSVDPAVAKRLERAGGMRLGPVRYRVYPRLGIDEDCFSLGAVLLRLLLVNDRQDLLTVTEVVDAVLREHVGAQAKPQSGQLRLEGAMRVALALHGPALAKANVFWNEADRAGSRVNALPDDAWMDALRLAFGLLEHGLTTGRAGDRQATDPAPLETVLSAGEALLRRLLSVLFRRQMVNLEVQAVIAEVLAEAESTAG